MGRDEEEEGKPSRRPLGYGVVVYLYCPPRRGIKWLWGVEGGGGYQRDNGTQGTGKGGQGQSGMGWGMGKKGEGRVNSKSTCIISPNVYSLVMSRFTCHKLFFSILLYYSLVSLSLFILLFVHLCLVVCLGISRKLSLSLFCVFRGIDHIGKGWEWKEGRKGWELGRQGRQGWDGMGRNGKEGWEWELGKERTFRLASARAFYATFFFLLQTFKYWWCSVLI
jgi:hypothetical protein